MVEGDYKVIFYFYLKWKNTYFLSGYIVTEELELSNFMVSLPWYEARYHHCLICEKFYTLGTFSSHVLDAHGMSMVLYRYVFISPPSKQYQFLDIIWQVFLKIFKFSNWSTKSSTIFVYFTNKQSEKYWNQIIHYR